MKQIPHQYSDPFTYHYNEEIIIIYYYSYLSEYIETKYEDMIIILQHVQSYVPDKTMTREVTLPNQVAMEYLEQHYAVTLIGGDQLTVACALGAQKISSNSYKSDDRLDGLLPVVKDWHAKMYLLQVIIMIINVML